MRHEVLGALQYPGEVANAEFVCVEQDGSQRQPSRIGKCLRLPRRAVSGVERQALLAKSLRYPEVQAKKIASIVAHGAQSNGC